MSYDLFVPPSEIIFDLSASEATTVYDASGWHTRVLVNYSGNIFLGSLAWGVERVFWWPFAGPPMQEEDPQYGSQEYKMAGLGWVYPKGSGMPTDEFHPRQANHTYKLTVSKIGGFSSVEKITDTQYRFVVNGKDVYVLWSDVGLSSIPGDISGTVKVTDYLGNEEIKNANQVELTETPVFVEAIPQ